MNYIRDKCALHSRQKELLVFLGKSKSAYLKQVVVCFKYLVVPLTVFNVAAAQTCAGKVEYGAGGAAQIWNLDGGGIAAFARMNIDLDGYPRAYHPKNFSGGAVVHLCNAGRVYLPDGGSYDGSENNTICTGRFMEDYKRIGDAGWRASSVGAISWYGVVAEDSVIIHGVTVRNVKPILQKDGSGFYVSPTSLQDSSFGVDDQSRYVNPTRVAFAVVPGNFLKRGITLGSFGVAADRKGKVGIPFVVGDVGPRIGEGSAALARLLAGIPLTDHITLQNRNSGQVDAADILWVFFAKGKVQYHHADEAQLAKEAAKAYEEWGGSERLLRCLNTVPRN